MFDIGFPELLLILVVSLLVIGPERLPETIRTLALWFGRLKRSFSDIKAEIEAEIGADEIRQQLHNEKILEEFEKTKEKLNSAVRELDEGINRESAFLRTPFEKDPDWQKQQNPFSTEKPESVARNKENGATNENTSD